MAYYPRPPPQSRRTTMIDLKTLRRMVHLQKMAENPPFKLPKPPAGVKICRPLVSKVLEEAHLSKTLTAEAYIKARRFLTASEREFALATYPVYLQHLLDVAKAKQERLAKENEKALADETEKALKTGV